MLSFCRWNQPDSTLDELVTAEMAKVQIYQKSQENRQKRANTDTRTEECTRARNSNPKPEKVKPPVNLGQQKSTY
ncbi:hypothetical protein Tco_0901942 [Tanacetum coccineum]